MLISRRQRRKLNPALSFLGSPADIILHPADDRANGMVLHTGIPIEIARVST